MRDYGMSLSAIERSYGCVAEYNRQREEDEEYAFEQDQKAFKYYKENSRKLEEAKRNGTLQYFCYDCVGCRDYVSIGMTSIDDDVEHGICTKNGCCKYKECQLTASAN